MKLVRWLTSDGCAPRPGSNLHALLKVSPLETANLDLMLELVDGKTAHYGVSVRLVGYGDDTPVVRANRCAEKAAPVHFPDAQSLRCSTRYFEIYVHRD